MNNKPTKWNKIVDSIFGHKYYANITNRRGVIDMGLAQFIFRTKEEARSHKLSLDDNASFSFVETISFRSHETY